MQAIQQNVLHKLLCRQSGQLCPKGQDDGVVDIQRGQGIHLVAQSGDARWRQIGLLAHTGKVVARVRLE